MDVGEWLRGLDLGECEGHRIDSDATVRRTMADDLKKIDVSAVGDRRRVAMAG